MAASLGATATGALVLIGWWLDVPLLKSLSREGVAMNPATAVGFILAASALWRWRSDPDERPGRRWALAAALALIVLGASRLVEYLFGWGPRLDQWLFAAELERASPPNRMAPNTAFNFVLLGLALWHLDSKARRLRLSQGLAVAVLIVSFLPLIGHLYRAAPFTRLGPDYISMALNTALAFTAVAFGVLCARPDEGLMARLTSNRLSSRMLRRLLPALVLIPVMLGFFRLWGEPIWGYDKPFGAALSATGVAALSSALLWWQSRAFARMEEALFDREIKLATLVNTSPDIIVIRDREGRFLLANPALAELLGRPLSDILGRRDSELFGASFDAASVRRIQESDRGVMESGAPSTYVMRIQTVHGEERAFLSSKYPYRSLDGELLGTITISRDITEREQLEKALRDTQFRMQTVVDNSPVFLFDLDADGRILLARGLGLASLALQPESLAGRTIDEVFSAFPSFISSYRRALAGESFRESLEFQDVAFDVWFTPLRSQTDEKIVGVLGVATDVSVRRRLEDQLRSNYEKLKELDRLKSDFVNSVSHDLRTPLTSILGYAEFIEDGMGGPITPEQRDYVGQIEKSAKRLEGMVNDMLDFARMDAGTFRLRCEPTDLTLKIREVVESLKPQSDEKSLRLEAVLPEPPVTLSLDPERIERVLANLIGNAIKFTPPNGRIEVRARQEEDRIVCEVVDTGVGIASEDLSKLFRRFSQLEAGALKKSGTGLGLSISKALVEAHGGTIGVRSEPGMGSTFWFSLPLVLTETIPAAATG